MKYSGIMVAAALAAACASNSPPPAASGESVEQASNTPSSGADFAPAANDGTASASNGASSTGNDGMASTNSGMAAGNGAGSSNTAHTGTATTSTAKAMPSASGMDADRQHTTTGTDMASNAAAMPAPAPGSTAPDNTRVNARDKDPKALTPMDQGGGESDRKITQQIRQAVMKDGSLSFTAKNVKIITINGKVTLRGPVKTDAERSAIEAAAKSAAGVGQVDNQIEVKK